MKANEFVKKYGWEDAMLAVKGLLPVRENIPVFDYGSEDLKRLVESYDLVSKATPEELYQAEICEGIWCNHRLAQAIADVESCHVD